MKTAMKRTLTSLIKSNAFQQILTCWFSLAPMMVLIYVFGPWVALPWIVFILFGVDRAVTSRVTIHLLRRINA